MLGGCNSSIVQIREDNTCATNTMTSSMKRCLRQRQLTPGVSIARSTTTDQIHKTTKKAPNPTKASKKTGSRAASNRWLGIIVTLRAYRTSRTFPSNGMMVFDAFYGEASEQVERLLKVFRNAARSGLAGVGGRSRKRRLWTFSRRTCEQGSVFNIAILNRCTWSAQMKSQRQLERIL